MDPTGGVLWTRYVGDREISVRVADPADQRRAAEYDASEEIVVAERDRECGRKTLNKREIVSWSCGFLLKTYF